MTKYIDAERLKAEIERRKEKWLAASRLIKKGRDQAMYAAGKSSAYTEFFSLIDSLQQEQPKQKKNCNDCSHCVDRKDQYGWHFKGCFGGPYKGKFIAEIDECPLQQEDIPETALCATCPNRRNTHAYQDGYDAGRADALKEMKNR